MDSIFGVSYSLTKLTVAVTVVRCNIFLPYILVYLRSVLVEVPRCR
jgi:hypothetical protein